MNFQQANLLLIKLKAKVVLMISKEQQNELNYFFVSHLNFFHCATLAMWQGHLLKDLNKLVVVGLIHSNQLIKLLLQCDTFHKVIHCRKLQCEVYCIQIFHGHHHAYLKPILTFQCYLQLHIHTNFNANQLYFLLKCAIIHKFQV